MRKHSEWRSRHGQSQCQLPALPSCSRAAIGRVAPRFRSWVVPRHSIHCPHQFAQRHPIPWRLHDIHSRISDRCGSGLQRGNIDLLEATCYALPSGACLLSLIASNDSVGLVLAFCRFLRIRSVSAGEFTACIAARSISHRRTAELFSKRPHSSTLARWWWFGYRRAQRRLTCRPTPPHFDVVAAIWMKQLAGQVTSLDSHRPLWE